uniref:Uncharacterized protein n=1 Tax=Tanacetum cinerariifolium TaxID=118510 RepID=A0A6L2K3S2_TANCI|nr:hypothetical protein [Tanacetum cinerariifolium]
MYHCRPVALYCWTSTGLVTLDQICPSTCQLLRSTSDDSGPDMSFDMSASPEYLSGLAHASLVEVKKVELIWCPRRCVMKLLGGGISS